VALNGNIIHSKKFLLLANENKKEEKHELTSLNDLYKYKGELKASLLRYLNSI